MNMHVSPTHVAANRSIRLAKRPSISTLEKAIAEHKTAARLLRNREADLKKLLDAHPDLANAGPLIHFWTRQDGTKC